MSIYEELTHVQNKEKKTNKTFYDKIQEIDSLIGRKNVSPNVALIPSSNGDYSIIKNPALESDLVHCFFTND